MGRKSQTEYTNAAAQVLEELGGGPIASRDLVAAAKERGLIEDNKWTYHYLLKATRASELFDTSKRGYVSLVEPVSEGSSELNVTEEPVVEAVPVEVVADEEETA